MGAEFRFTGTNIDATVVTDAPRGARTFFATELRGYDPTDIMGGVDVEIQEYHEADLVAIARTHNLQLDRLDADMTTCLVVPAVAAGRFNGSTSVLQVADVTLASSNVPAWPITIGLTWRMTSEDFAALAGSCDDFYLVSSDLTGQTRFEMHLTPGPRDPEGNFATVLVFNFFIGGARGAFLVWRSPFGVQDMCIETEVRFTADSDTVTAELYVNGEQQATDTFPTLNFNMDDFDIAYGALQTNQAGGISYQGIMLNLFIDAGGTRLVDIADPSTGTNTGTEADGTATDIISVSVIV